MISDSSHTLIMNVLSKTQKMKKHLQEAGLSFPTSVDQGEMINRQSKSHFFNVFHTLSLLTQITFSEPAFF